MDYQGNSNKAKEEAAKPEEPKKNVEKVIVGEVVEKEPGFGHKVKHIFFGGDVKDVAQFVFYEKALPGLRDMLFDMGSDGWHRMLYGIGGKRGPAPQQSRQKTTYNSSPVRRYMDPRGQGAPSPNRPGSYSPGPRRQQEMNDIILTTREDAQRVLDTMNACVEQYQVVSLADLKELVGLPQAHIDQKWGWTFLTSSEIRQVREGFLLELPKLEEIE